MSQTPEPLRRRRVPRRRPRLRPARRRQDGDRVDRGPHRPRRPLDGLHAGRGAGVRGDRRGPGPGRRLHLGLEHRRGRHRRHRGPRARRHRPGRRDARDGGQGRAVQAVRRRRRRADLPGHQGRRRDRGDGGPARAQLRRHQPRGHLGPALLRDRAAAQGPARHPGVPRRPARYGGRGARRARGRAADHRSRHRRGPGRDLRRRRRGRRGGADPAGRGRVGPRGHRPARRAALRPRRPDPGQAVAGPGHRRPHRPHRHPRGRARGRRRLHRRLRRHRARGGRGHDGRRGRDLRSREPHAGGAPGGRAPACPGRRDRPVGLPEPDQQRAGLPGHLPRGLRRPGHRDHREHEAGRSRTRSPGWSATTCARTTSCRRPSTARRSGRGRRRRRRRRGPRGRRRAAR